MAPKKSVTETKVNAKKPVGTGSKNYRDLIKEGLVSLNDKKGSSRLALKNFIKKNYPVVYSAPTFTYHFNSAINKGVEAKLFNLPKGPAGTVKLTKIEKPVKKQIKKKESTATTTTSDKKKIIKPKSKSTPSTSTTTTTTTAAAAASSKKTSTVSKPKSKAVVKKDKKKDVSKSSNGPLSYKQMITIAITSLNNGKGSSRTALKSYIQENYFKEKQVPNNFNSLFNTTIRKGLESNDFSQPKGPSGIVKINKQKKKVN
ncbi:hypothetical protein Kpol_1072p43 [Vanderwaltozyma polyspora DSM 70294]|uniref:Histone H1 n=1 Tax=Vanderwaltozyma polyspora (strain ATCC 22028 / DSM 70294 / BCRC 21397 / CBS 2163 / NBRC 10782 / NRRL Y-8283 / UCD 57-17) TaxID=436907 RepID=A7TKR1_VANPO|nr:uncharacterized protein Kpol_1072p43 [Vanderwaltozyma polyspora DSM 70294]EDO17173.1 hypothetical protein Kpol_1072p43 [Vanderwaltozyma polyspora DSM 70294]